MGTGRGSNSARPAGGGQASPGGGGVRASPRSPGVPGSWGPGPSEGLGPGPPLQTPRGSRVPGGAPLARGAGWTEGAAGCHLRSLTWPLSSEPHRAEPARPRPPQPSGPPKKEGRLGALTQVCGRGKKEERRAPPGDGRLDAHRGEPPSEVDDIITTFDSVLGSNCQEQPGDPGPMVGFKKRTAEDSKYLWPDKRPLARQGLPPIRTQSLPPIAAGNGVPTACPGPPPPRRPPPCGPAASSEELERAGLTAQPAGRPGAAQ